MKDTKVIAALLAVIVIIALGVIMHELRSVLLPFVLALMLSYIFKPVVLYLRNKKFPTAVAILTVLIAVSGALFSLSLLIYKSFESFAKQFPKYEAKIQAAIADIQASMQNLPVEFQGYINALDWTSAIEFSSLTAFVTSGLGSFINFFSYLFLIILYMVFILAGGGQVAAKVKVALHNRFAAKISDVIENIDRQVRQYLLMKTMISLGTGTLTTVLLLIFGVDFAVFWGFLTFLLNYIPNVGSVLATVFPIGVSLLQYGSLGRSVGVAIALIGAQMVMGNIVEPKVMEKSLNLSPLLVLISLIFWGWLWGVWGMVLAVPIVSTIKIIFENVDVLKPIAVLMSGEEQKVSVMQSS